MTKTVHYLADHEVPSPADASSGGIVLNELKVQNVYSFDDGGHIVVLGTQNVEINFPKVNSLG